MCTPHIVNAALKRKIAAHAAAFREVTASPFGPADEIGMLNLIDGESRDKIMSRVDASKIFDLSVDNFVGMPSWTAAGDPNYQIWMTHTPPGGNFRFQSCSLQYLRWRPAPRRGCWVR